ncbi:LacI family transcriptional regulator [Modestobacter lapidis]|nr:LacI family transcriptional regulator [Modestobacter lapidis]
MRDVAARARVSAKTVSRVFNDDPHVLPETRARVTEALRELGYLPNSLARTFRTGRPPVLGVAVPDLADPFFAVLATAVEQVAARADMAVVVSSLGYDPAREAVALESLLRRSLSGLVVAPTSQDQGHLGTWAARLPVVFVDRPPRGLTADAFTGDDHEGGRLATAHLIAHGHRDIAFVGDSPAMTTTGERLAGHRSALADAGLRPRDELVAFGAGDRGSAERVVGRLRSAVPPPTALVSGDARTTMTLVPALAGSSWAVVGFGDFPMAHMLSPAVTVVDQDPAALGRLAAERVVERLGAPERRFRRHTVLPVRLVERRSCWSPADASALFPSSCPRAVVAASPPPLAEEPPP